MNNILDVYLYGSRVYGTASEESDYDFIMVCKNNSIKNEFSLEKNNYNIHLYDLNAFENLLNKHKISALECFYLPEEFIFKKSSKIIFKIDKNILRNSLSEKASHSWVKAKKKFSVENDIKRAKKSLFHSFRIIDFGKQICANEKIVNYNSCNALWDEINNNSSKDWNDYEKIYKQKFNSEMTEFRVLAPKKS